LAHTLTTTPRPLQSRSLNLNSDAAKQARIELAACFRLAARFGFAEGICNHFSAVVPGHDDLMFINPFGYAFAEITASLLLVCDFDGHVVAGDGAPEATAFFIHARLHRLKPRVKVALHTHMPNATALSMLEGQPLLWAGQTALKFYGRTAVDEHYNGLALDDSEGDRIANAIGEGDVVFLKNHGVMVTGPNVAEAWDDLYYLERAAEVQLKAMSAGRPLKNISPAVAQQTFEQMRVGDPTSARAHLNSMMRVLRAEGVHFDQ
jgi:ribulose-5-phosphate 4-epimerase/fuculose-1-phosphate aldolase